MIHLPSLHLVPNVDNHSKADFFWACDSSPSAVSLTFIAFLTCPSQRTWDLFNCCKNQNRYQCTLLSVNAECSPESASYFVDLDQCVPSLRAQDVKEKFRVGRRSEVAFLHIYSSRTSAKSTAALQIKTFFTMLVDFLSQVLSSYAPLTAYHSLTVFQFRFKTTTSLSLTCIMFAWADTSHKTICTIYLQVPCSGEFSKSFYFISFCKSHADVERERWPLLNGFTNTFRPSNQVFKVRNLHFSLF